MRGVVRARCGYESHAGVGARRVGAASGSARFDAVDEKEMMHPLDGVRVELREDAGRVESCF
jgi:hypothetical protein